MTEHKYMTNLLNEFEPSDTDDYIRQKIDICANEMIKKISQYEIDFNKKKEELDLIIRNNCKKLNFLEKSYTNFQAELENLCQKFAKEIIEQQKITSELKKEALNNKKELQEFKTFKNRANEIIMSLQSRVDILETSKSNEYILTKKVNALESKINTQNSKIKNLENLMNKDLVEKITNETCSLIQKSTSILDLKIKDSITTNEERHQSYQSNITQLVSELNILRESSDEKIQSTQTANLINMRVLLKNDMKSLINENVKKEIFNHINILKKRIDEINKVVKEKKQVKQVKQEDNKESMNDVSKRLSSVEQQLICQMTTIHNLSMPKYDPSHGLVVPYYNTE